MVLALTALAQAGRSLAFSQGAGALLAIAFILPVSLLAYVIGAYCHAWLLSAFAVLCSGFLIYNRKPALIRPGAGGAAFLALMPGLLAALSAETIGLHIWILILVLYAVAIVGFGRKLKA
jgi:UDP-N-acetylmuramyl pentapeptide phosphotransferase/UDP-N-acetylglucosamine-1-phosphate transferase